VVDAVVAALAALVALFVGGEAEESGRLTGGPLFWCLVLAGIGCLALLWRRRWPVGVALLLVPMFALTELVAGAVLVAVYTVAANRRWVVAFVVAGLMALAYVPYSIVRPDPDVPLAAGHAFNVATLAVVVAIGTVVRSRRETIAALRERAARAEAEADLRAERLRGQERERIAREMHDALAHRISLVSLHAGALAIRPDLSAEEIARAANTIRDSAHLALEDLREILGVLRAGSAVDSLGVPPGLADLDALVADSRAAGTDLAVDNRLTGPPAPDLLSRTAYRVVQEGLTNARKHAPGVPVRLWLERHDGGLRIRLANPLAPAGPVASRGPLTAGSAPLRPLAAPADAAAIPGARSGLVGLAERVGVLGGRLTHGVRRGPDGAVAFHLEAWLPWPT
jgi:signal transduction histidine kinase